MIDLSNPPSWPYYPKDVKYHLDYPPISLGEALDKTAKEFPNTDATIFFGARIKYQKLKELTDNFAANLQSLGIKKGDRVALILPNSPQAVIAFYGALKAGAVVVWNNPMYTERELHHQLSDSGSKIVITLDLILPRVLNIKAKTSLEKVVVTRLSEFMPPLLKLLYPVKVKKEKQWVEIPKEPFILGFQDLLKSPPQPLAKITINPEEDLAVLQYTGGTTGVSKGVMLTHRNLIVNAMQVNAWDPIRSNQDIILAVMPFFHVYGLSVALNLAILTGATLLIMPRFNVDELLKTIAKYRPTLFPGAPTIYVAIINHPRIKDYDITSIRLCISGSAPLPVEVKKKFEEITGGRIVEGYGLTESSPVTHCNPVRSLEKPGSVGLPLSDTLCQIVEPDTLNPVPLGEVGEIAVKGPQVMKGYWNRPEETKLVLKDGWLLTGDLGRMDEDGYLYIVDRKKDLIISGGYNIYPREVEEVLYEHPKVKEAVVIGVPDEYRGEVVKAFIVLKENETATPEEIIKYCQEKLAKYKVPKYVEFRTELPKTTVGKVLRRALREEAKK
ncbi:long-chain fatty acid--CoA ligase [Carboxydothermus islandicus]|uniref:Long-chain fatty acid--CoA ligase n=1 Tax=Carboxydothermus islandicus TaxID=661089 RepID=A0A1L8D2T3_9THEO|nr:long-chain fatty acid--CoA ligase [Carboxydothermus islandicus]GAV25492.1 long-chain fatty acid--CoA ligase [Carboxydothermus islandicus]